MNDKQIQTLKEKADSYAYADFRQYRDTLRTLKKELKETAEKRAEINTQYQNYLRANPYKAKRKELNKKVQQQRETIMRLI